MDAKSKVSHMDLQPLNRLVQNKEVKLLFKHTLLAVGSTIPVRVAKSVKSTNKNFNYLKNAFIILLLFSTEITLPSLL